jgi:two-component sensor histidine kinase/ABC-type nitrate/sulfonate/bicarbonate transport system substrate-binding protein
MVARRSVFFAALLAIVSVGLAAQASPRLERVALQLKWYNQFQFAGYYVAKERGYYRDAGLDVTIREGTPSTNFTEEVLSGRAQYGIDNTDLLVDRVHGKKVIVLGAIFQHSPVVILSLAKSGIVSPENLIGKRVMATPDAEAEVFAMISNEGIPLKTVHFMPHTWNVDDLVQGKADAISAYITNEPLVLHDRGLDYRLIRPVMYGIDFYGDCLFTSEAEASRHAARVKAFLKASLEGWDWAMEHPGETCDLILARYPVKKDRAALLEEAAATDELIVHKFVPLGFMNPGRWKHIGDTYARLGFIPADYTLDGFLYDPDKPAVDPRIYKAAGIVALAGLAAALIYITALLTFNRRLGREVAVRTSSLETLNAELERQIAQRTDKERQLQASLEEKEVLLKEIHHRVKNNLQIIASLVSLESDSADVPEAARALSNVRNRVIAMALVHEHLYSGPRLGRIDMQPYLSRLTSEIVSAGQRSGLRIVTEIDAQDLSFNIEEAMPLGLIVTELVSNSVKHAFAGRKEGRIEVRLRSDVPDEGGAERFVLVVRDDGIGVSGQAGASARSGIGLQLVESLARQLGAVLESGTGGGRSTTLTFAREVRPEKS